MSHRLGRLRFLLLWLVMTLAACSAIPGANRQAQQDNVEALLASSLADVKRQHPQAASELEQAVGYVVLDNNLTKIPVFGVGRGYGVAVDSRSGARTYLRLRRFDFGAGWGVRRVRPVLVFFDAEKFRHFIDGSFEIRLMAEAAVKAEVGGAASSTGVRNNAVDKAGYSAYLLTDKGVSATWVLGFIRVKPVELKQAD